MVRRDRNHAAVVICECHCMPSPSRAPFTRKRRSSGSACNEVECHVRGMANVTGKLMHDATKRWDTTRPFSANLNQINAYVPAISLRTPLNDTEKFLAKYLDVEGFSHGSIAAAGAGSIHAANPGKPVISSECCSCETQRGLDYYNITEGFGFAHTQTQAECMTRTMNFSYPFWSKPSTNTPIGEVAGTLGVWTLFDCASNWA
jgi:hypothetical protein